MVVCSIVIYSSLINYHKTYGSETLFSDLWLTIFFGEMQSQNAISSKVSNFVSPIIPPRRIIISVSFCYDSNISVVALSMLFL